MSPAAVKINYVKTGRANMSWLNNLMSKFLKQVALIGAQIINKRRDQPFHGNECCTCIYHVPLNTGNGDD